MHLGLQFRAIELQEDEGNGRDTGRCEHGVARTVRVLERQDCREM